MRCRGREPPGSGGRSARAYTRAMRTYLLKTEPGEFGFDDLAAKKSSVWDGVANNQALAVLRTVKRGDRAFIYHTGDEKAVVGLAEFVSGAYADPAQPGETAEGLPKFAVADVKALRRAKTPVTLAAIKGDARFKDFALVKQSRLSVMLVPDDLTQALMALAGL